MNKISKIISVTAISLTALLSLTGCFESRKFLEECVTTDDGFVYYIQDGKGLCIIEVPDVEEIVIPKYIDGHQVVQIGYMEESFFGRYFYFPQSYSAKKITVQSYIDYVGFNLDNVETLTVINPATSLNVNGYKQLIIDNNLRNRGTDSFNDFPKLKEINLEKKETAELEVENFSIEEILISDLIITIESGVFANLENVIIKTSYESKPEGWEEGWNGNCLVEWGVDVSIDY